ncbi:TonB-dependent receptor [Mucilaginibacter sp. BJC16-A38]|uniref:TonB-dependent receptor n=1 Tax=Mucilaginibacter phenanthrenivorans TaxID=1234842 RepID=UPI0021570397|nr:TonB-dependent receptor [Mucilaginibacter phenanthrenivorans]MCR8560533.1 TonB-dependent receptor [Mucilaginibacter phenanthrenivorans]
MNLKLPLLLFGALFMFCSPIFAQKITGTVTAAGKPLQESTVRVFPSGIGTTTDIDGKYSLDLKAGTYKVSFTAIGYEMKTVSIQLAVGENKVVDITMAVSSESLKEVIVVGSRGGGRTKMDSPVPVDVISVNSVSSTTAKPDLMSQLNQSVPSFNYNKQSGGDGSDAIDFASLRGLGFDQTLVLVNGKRRHLSAFVNQVGTRGRGNSGTDLNAIPEAAIDHVEILRDGASAQYGSDAIAGVINLVLKKDVNHLTVNIGGSGYYDHKYNTLNNVDPSQYYTGSQIDGKTFTLGLDYGVSIGKNGGFINFGGNFMDQGKTFRAVPQTNWDTNPNALSVDAWRRAFGDGSVTSGGGMYNMEIPLAGTKTTFYSFGGYNYKHSNVYAWTRRWSSTSNHIKFPTDANGNLIFVPGIMRVFDPTAGSLDTANVYYNPQEDVYIKDMSNALGLKGTIGDGWDWDLSNNIGYNDFHYWGNDTFNASLPLPEQSTKTRFDDGGFNFLQNTANLDVTKRFAHVAQGLTLSFGAEFRYERYKLYAGEPDSYRNGGALYTGPTIYNDDGSVALANGDAKASGSEGYPGYQPTDASTSHRTNEAAYVEGSLDVTKAWLVDGAARFEHYSDFGGVSTVKLATRYKVTDNFNLRGSFSTGFRAPSLQQMNFSNTNTNIIAGQLVYAKLVPNYSEAARQVGIPKLTQETSINESLGFTWKPAPGFNFTVDGYIIKIKNRIVITGSFDTTVTAIKNYLIDNNVKSANFFTNAVNTTNRGIDMVLDYHKSWGKNRFTGLLAGNIQGITINKINIPAALNDTYAHQQAYFSTREAAFLTASAPHSKFSLGLEYGYDKFAVGTHITYFGKLTTQGFGYNSVPGANPDGPGGANTSASGNGWDPYVELDNGKGVVPENFVFHGKATTDLYVSYKITKEISWTAGVDNIFNVHPDLAVTEGAHQSSWGDSESGGPFDAVQMGFNGTRIFTKLAFHF